MVEGCSGYSRIRLLSYSTFKGVLMVRSTQGLSNKSEHNVTIKASCGSKDTQLKEQNLSIILNARLHGGGV